MNITTSSSPATCVDIKRQLRTWGYSFFHGNQVVVSSGLRKSAESLLEEFDQLPADPYCKDGTRLRRYGVFLLDARTEELRATTIHTYLQSSHFNSEHGDVPRVFAPLSEGLVGNAFLHALIRFDARQLPLPETRLSLPLSVGVHLLRLAPRPGQPAGAFPKLHKDGEWYTASHLIRREGVVGGDGLVTDNAKVPLWQGRQEEFLDTFVVVDAAVYHHVEPVELAPRATAGFRDVLLIDFTPLVPDIVPPRWECGCTTVLARAETFAARCERCGQVFRPAA